MKSFDQQPRFRVLIAGGGIAGLTLANALQHAGIDYLLLEARSEIAPQLGASIGLSPGGNRILDQLGCYDDIMALTEPLDYNGTHYPNGDYIRKTDGYRLVRARTNYGLCFLDRQSALQILFDHIANKEKVLLNKRIEKADHHNDGVTVTCADGSSYSGDILVGADGVFSLVRQEMWRASEAVSPGAIPDVERKCMLAEYKCLFGISSRTVELPAREMGVTFMKDLSSIVIASKDGRVYWFLTARMSQIYRAGEIPRFSKDEARVFAEEHLDIPLVPGKKVTFRDLWENRKTFNLVALEEAYFNHWTWGRFVCLGDSIHKMTPHMGSGGNAAIESAAALANSLHELLSQTSTDCSLIDNVRQALHRYQDSRSVRASATVKASSFVTRLHAVRGFVEHIYAFYLMPNAGDFLYDLASDNWIGAIRLNYLPIPPRSLGGTMPFNPEQGLGKNEHVLMRALAASPFLGLTMYHSRLMKGLLQSQALLRAIKTGRLVLGKASVYLFRNFYSIPFIDRLWRPAVALFLRSNLGYDAGGSWQLRSSLADFGTVYTILLIESARRANLLTPMQMPILFGIASQLWGPGTVMPLYYFIHSTLVPISRFKATDLRLTDMSYTRSVLPVMLLAYYVPYIAAYLGPSITIRQTAVWIFQMSPLWVSLGQWILKRTVIPSTVQQDRLCNVNRDLGSIRLTVGSLAFWSGLSWLNVMPMAPLPLREIFLPPGAGSTSVVGGAQNIFIYDQLFFSASSLLWVLYFFRDLKKARMVPHGWLKILFSMAVSNLFFGPGATVALAWLYREEVLSTKRHKGALTHPESVEKMP